ncbi:MAG: hypothetical protein ACYCO9_08340 [Streptosporangiaceae bacterium]
MRPQLPDHLDRLAQLQRGILAAAQIRQAGLTKDLIHSQVRAQRWQRLHRGVYAIFTGNPDREGYLWAAVLRGGAGALLSYYTAAEVHGLIDRQSAAIHLTIPESRRVLPVRGIVIHVSSRAGRAAHPTQLPPRTSVPETILDLAQVSATAEAACGWITRGIGRRLTSRDRLRRALDQRGRIRFRTELAEVLGDDSAGVHSALEYRYLHRVEIPHGLPRGRRQARAMCGSSVRYRDVLYDAFRLIVELDGRAAHPGDTRWNDIRRDNAAAADGQVTLRYGWDDITRRPCLVAAQVAATLSLTAPAGVRFSPRPCSPDCPVRPGPGASRS